MPKKAMETLTETMFYVLMAFQQGPLCGTDAAELIQRRSGGRRRARRPCARGSGSGAAP